MVRKIGKSSYIFENQPIITGYGSVVGKKEGEGPYRKYFDYVSEDERFGEECFEKAESTMQKMAIVYALDKAKVSMREIDGICAGDLLNQCIGSSFAARDMNIPFIGIYGACSTMALSMILVSMMIEGGGMKNVVSCASSHFCAAERQYRFPLEYGNQRTPTAQWTVTGAGAFVISGKGEGPKIAAATFGEIKDLGITDQNNMGAAMAPDDVKIRPYPRHEGMVFFYTQIQYLRGVRALFKDFSAQKNVEKTVNKIRLLSSIH